MEILDFFAGNGGSGFTYEEPVWRDITRSGNILYRYSIKLKNPYVVKHNIWQKINDDLENMFNYNVYKFLKPYKMISENSEICFIKFDDALKFKLSRS